MVSLENSARNAAAKIALPTARASLHFVPFSEGVAAVGIHTAIAKSTSTAQLIAQVWNPSHRERQVPAGNSSARVGLWKTERNAERKTERKSGRRKRFVALSPAAPVPVEPAGEPERSWLSSVGRDWPSGAVVTRRWRLPGRVGGR